MHTGQHYDEAMSEGQILATRLPRPAPQPRRRLARARGAARARTGAPGELIDARAPRRGDRPRRHQRHALRRPRRGRRRRAAGARRGGAALATATDMPEEHNRDRDRPARPAAPARRPRARGATSMPRASPGEIHVTGDPLCDMLERWRARCVAGRAATTCSRRCTATTTPTTPSASARCWPAWRARRGRS